MILVERLDVAELQAGRVGRPDDCHVFPLSVVRSTTPSVAVYPLTQAAFSLTAESPRKCAVVPVGVTCHE